MKISPKHFNMQNQFFYGGVDIRDFNLERNTKIILLIVVAITLSLMWIAGIVTYVKGMESLGGCLIGISLGFTILLFVIIVVRHFCENDDYNESEIVETEEEDNNEDLKEVVINL